MQISHDEIDAKKCLFWLLGISLNLFVFISSAGADEKLLKMRLGGFQSKIETNFAEINSPNNQQPIVLGLDEKVQSNFKTISNNKNNIAFLYFDGEKLAAEKYNYTAEAITPLYLYSITKSFTGMMLLQEICKSANISLNDKIGQHSARLEKTVYGDVSIRNVLKMQSGVGKDFFKKTQIKMFLSFLNREKTPLDWINGIADKKPEGQNFWYNANDTNAIGVLLEDLSGQSIVDNFAEKFVYPSNVSSTVYWQQARGGETIGAYGLMARPRDAVSLAIQYLAVLDTEECVEAHFNKMFEADKSRGIYGFQIRRHQTLAKESINKLYMAGHGGQYLILDRDTGSVAFIYSVFGDYSSKPVIDTFYKSVSRLP